MAWQTPTLPQYGQDNSPSMFDPASDNWTFDQSHPHTAPIKPQSTFDYAAHSQGPHQHQAMYETQQQHQQQQQQTPNRGQHPHPHMHLHSHAKSVHQLPNTYSTPPQAQSGFLHPVQPVTPLNYKAQSQVHLNTTHSQYTGRSNTLSVSTNGSIPNTPAPPYYTSQGGYPTPVYSPLTLHPHSRDNNSPTLAPEYSLSQQKDPLVGLGIGLGMGMGMGMGSSTGVGTNPSSSHSSSSISLSNSNEGQTQDMTAGLQVFEDAFYTSPYCA